MSAKEGKKKVVKKQTGLAMTATKEENFADWYTQVIQRAEMIDYYGVSGCYIIRPWAYAIWEEIKEFLDKRIKSIDVQNAYFPMFVTQSSLMTEKDHVEGFAPEVAWVTKYGSSDLAEPIAIRPTSETVMYPSFAKWIQSHRDLPLKQNQWCNIVRWEFKHPQPFIRTREFLWQEGHTVHAELADAEEEVMTVLDFYSQVYEELLAVPVIKGKKSEKEKFAGAIYTTTVEAFIPETGRGVQGATSHCLGQNFAKMFDIKFEDKNGGSSLPWQNSWGLTTRTIGVLVMVHGDNKGLVLPPRVSPIQVVIVPILGKNSEGVLEAADELKRKLHAAGIRVKLDDRANQSPGWKFNYWELRGVSIRLELGPKDLANGTCVLAFRHTGQKITAQLDDILQELPTRMDQMQKEMLTAAKERVDRDHTAVVESWEQMVPSLNARKMCLTPWCQEKACEENVKKRTGTESVEDNEGLSGAAKTLCIPFDQPELPETSTCIGCGKKATTWVLWGRSY